MRYQKQQQNQNLFTHFILLCCVLTILYACSGRDKASDTLEMDISEVTPVTNLVTKTISVSGMHCTGCENTITVNVSELEGISSVDASFEKQQTEVIFDSTKVSIQQIYKAIENAGYKVAE